MRCQEAQVLLSTRRDLNMSQRVELEAHLEVCRVCAAARREEDRVTRLLAALPDLGLAPPPRVEMAITARAARRSAGVRRRQGLALAASLGTVVIVAAVLLNIVSGGRLDWFLFGQPGVQTGSQPVAPVDSAAGSDVLYLVHRVGASASLIAWRPATNQTVFRVPLGTPPVLTFVENGGSSGLIDNSAPPKDFVLSPDGARLYVIEYGTNAKALVAYDARTGAERWRTPLRDYHSLINQEPWGALSVSPDGARVFVQSLRPTTGRLAGSPEQELRAYAAEDGRDLGILTRLSTMSHVLPISRDEVLTFSPSGGGMARGTIGPQGSWAFIEQSIALGLLLPDQQTVRAVTPDLKVLDLALTGATLSVASETDPIKRGGFFFERAAFSPDGRVLVVGQKTLDTRTGAIGSEVRIYQEEVWGETARYTINRPLVGVAMSSDGARAYIAFGRSGEYRWITDTFPTRPTPIPAPTPTSTRGTLVTIDVVRGVIVDTQELDPAIVGMFAGR